MRLKRYAGTEKGYEPITKLARAAIEERMNNTALTWPWSVEVQQNLDDAPQYVSGIRELLQKSGLKGWQKDYDKLVGELKRRTTNGYAPPCCPVRARRTGLPPEIYADNLKQYGVDADPRDLIQRARCLRTCRRVTRWIRSRESSPHRKATSPRTTAT